MSVRYDDYNVVNFYSLEEFEITGVNADLMKGDFFVHGAAWYKVLARSFKTEYGDKGRGTLYVEKIDDGNITRSMRGGL